MHARVRSPLRPSDKGQKDVIRGSGTCHGPCVPACTHALPGPSLAAPSPVECRGAECEGQGPHHRGISNFLACHARRWTQPRGHEETRTQGSTGYGGTFGVAVAALQHQPKRSVAWQQAPGSHSRRHHARRSQTGTGSYAHAPSVLQHAPAPSALEREPFEW